MTPEQQECLDLKNQGMSRKDIAAKLGVSDNAVKKRLARARKWERLDPDIQNRLKSSGKTNIDNLHSFWDVRDDGEGGRTSLYYNLGKDDSVNLEQLVDNAIEDRIADLAPTYPARPAPDGENLLVVDIADLHVGKLAVASETGFTYTREIARHRAIEGTRALLRHAAGHGVGRILFVTGNDIVHIDNPQGKTTSGTPQDTDGSFHQMISDAEAIIIDCIELCAEVAPVDIIYCPSNHDWIVGYTVCKTVAAWLKNHPNVVSTPYNLSERHRKYYRFGDNLIGLTHGDGAKEADLYPLMITEARQHVSECPNMYWYVHHLHHKIRKNIGRVKEQREKDLIGMTIVGSGSHVEGDAAQIEWVRSPSPPDGWHDRNGYVNRQAVECFMHHPTDGQFARFTEWF